MTYYDSNTTGLAQQMAMKCIRAVVPSDFVALQTTFELWNVMIPNWMQPVFRAGYRPEPEPFWRRLEYEMRNGIDGEYMKINKKDIRIDKCARQLLLQCLRKVLLRKIIYKTKFMEHCLKVDREHMSWEDAAGIACRQNERLARREKLEKELNDEKRHGKSPKWWEFWSYLKPSKARVMPSSIVVSPPSEQWHIQRILTRPSNQYLDMHVVYGYDLEAVSNNLDKPGLRAIADIKAHVASLTRKTSWVTGQAVVVDLAGMCFVLRVNAIECILTYCCNVVLVLVLCFVLRQSYNCS